MRKLVALLILMVGLVSCNDDDVSEAVEICAEDYFYYSDHRQVTINPAVNYVWIAFEQAQVTREEAESILSKYEYLHLSAMPGSGNYREVPVNIVPDCDCDLLKSYLTALNDDPEIEAATPFFYLKGERHGESYFILLNEIVAQPAAGVSTTDFENLVQQLDMEIIEADKYNTFSLEVNAVHTGFEPLEKANELYESNQTLYSHPNFIAP